MPVTAAQLIALAESFDWSTWSTKWRGLIAQHQRDVVAIGGQAAAKGLGGVFNMDDPYTSSFMTKYLGERIVSLDATTKDKVVAGLRRTLADADDEITPFDLGTAVYDTVAEQFDGFARYRADTIARTETAIEFNHGNVLGMHQAGVQNVEVHDGDDDEECAAANGQVWPVSYALANPVAHPNCSRAFSPVLED